MNFEICVRETLPTIDDETCGKVVARLGDIGVESMEELPLVTEQDLLAFLPSIKVRKLLQSWKVYGEWIFGKRIDI